MKPFILFLIMATACLNAIAQKLPNQQEVSLRAPTNVKIDGKAIEWGEFKAYNSATELSYTLANDTQNLYLVIQTKSKGIVQKVFAGGISLFLDDVNNGDKNARGVITYSAIAKADRKAFDKALYDTSGLRNRTISTLVKTIAIKKLNDVNEEVISVYNEYGITAAGYLIDNSIYTCEIAVPLKYLKSFVNNKSALKYTLQVNGMSINSLSININGVVIQDNAASPQAMEAINMMMNANMLYANSIPIRDLMNPTNVSGEYILAK
jgi:hypothetical protein